MRHFELLAPARNADIGIAAIDCGADAVYIAGPGFGARQDAGNPMSEVERLCSYAHRFGVRIFLTLNTILYDSELPAAEALLREAAAAGVDAVIAQDLAVFEILRSAQNDNLPIHASTQCAIRTPEQARFYENLGATRIVLERQLSLEQIRAIREAVGCELEFFVHGALCVCYSGQCYMSEAISERSSNRGACIQACRSLYDLEDASGKTLVKDKALLSLKDYNLLGRLSDLAEAGVDSFKIEGRLKNISYVRNTVRAYSQALDELVAAHPDLYCRASFGRVSGGFKPDLAKTFNRGYTELFLDGKRGQWSSMDAPKSVGQPVGTVIQINAPQTPHRNPGSVSTIVIKLDNPALQLKNGDGFSFISKDGKSIVGFRADVCRGAVIQSRVVPELFEGARLFRNLDTAFEKEIEANLPVRRIPVSVDILVSNSAGVPSELRRYSAAAKRGWTSPGSDGSPAYSLIIKAESEDGRKVEFDLDGGIEPAGNKERMEAMFVGQIGKDSGIYSFSMDSLDVQTSDGSLPFMSVAALNGIRREIAARLDAMPEETPDQVGGDVGVIADDDLHVMPGKPSSVMPGLTGHLIDYKWNIANSSAREILQRLGATTIEPAFELTHREGAELMRSKYCIRHELGLCLRDSSAKGLRMTDLYLVNNGRRYRLRFDCSDCEMTVEEA